MSAPRPRVPLTRDAVRLFLLAEDIDAFAARCEEGEYTDTGEAWELLTTARDLARELAPLDPAATDYLAALDRAYNEGGDR